MEKINIKNTTVMCGIYLIQYPNGKVYVGQAQNIHLRILEHNSRARVGKRGDGKPLSLCDKKIKEYFPNGIEDYYVLETCSVEELDIKEDLWIKNYQALNKEYGYNFLDHGDVSGRRGVDNTNASLDKDALNKVVTLLINNYELSYQDIANKFNVSVNVIQNISWGKTYINLELDYPLRKHNHESQKKDILDYFQTEDELIKLKEELKYSWWLSIEKDLVNKYQIPLRIMHDINNGKKFEKIGEYEYPLRKKNIRNKNNLSKEDILNLLNDLKNTKKTMTEIGQQYNFDRSTISKINVGKSYFIKEYEYPARKTK